jgi:hypothetical protein
MFKDIFDSSILKSKEGLGIIIFIWLLGKHYCFETYKYEIYVGLYLLLFCLNFQFNKLLVCISDHFQNSCTVSYSEQLTFLYLIQSSVYKTYHLEIILLLVVLLRNRVNIVNTKHLLKNTRYVCRPTTEMNVEKKK